MLGGKEPAGKNTLMPSGVEMKQEGGTTNLWLFTLSDRDLDVSSLWVTLVGSDSSWPLIWFRDMFGGRDTRVTLASVEAPDVTVGGETPFTGRTTERAGGAWVGAARKGGGGGTVDLGAEDGVDVMAFFSRLAVDPTIGVEVLEMGLPASGVPRAPLHDCRKRKQSIVIGV